MVNKGSKAAPKKDQVTGPPRVEPIEGGRKYIVENQVGNANITVESTGRHMILLVINC